MNEWTDARWMEAAACKGKPTAWWFELWPRGRDLCETCPVTGECDAYARRAGEVGGWGGVQHQGVKNPQRFCRYCGRCFVHTHSTQRLCSRRCKRLWVRLEQRRRDRERREHDGSRLAAGHGTYGRYVDGCRCPACRAAGRDYMNARRLELAR